MPSKCMRVWIRFECNSQIWATLHLAYSGTLTLAQVAHHLGNDDPSASCANIPGTMTIAQVAHLAYFAAHIRHRHWLLFPNKVTACACKATIAWNKLDAGGDSYFRDDKVNLEGDTSLTFRFSAELSWWYRRFRGWYLVVLSSDVLQLMTLNWFLWNQSVRFGMYKTACHSVIFKANT